MREITAKQADVLDFIEKYIGDNSYSPTVRDIAGYFCVTPKAVHDYIVALTKKGFVKNSGKARTLVVLKKWRGE